MTEKKENVYEVRLINGVFSCHGYEKHTDLSSAHFGGKKKENKNKKWLYECKQVLHILFLIIHRWEWKKNKTGRLKRKSSRRLEIAATSINSNTLVLNQRKRARWHQNLLVNDWLSTDRSENYGIFKALDDR